MNNNTGAQRAIRLTRLQHLLHQHPQGLTTHELAQFTGVNVRTIQRDLLDIQSELGVPLTQDGRRYGIVGGYSLPPVFFTLNEAMSLFLASRLALRQTDENNPHMQQALVKVSDVLPAPVGERLRAGMERIGSLDVNQAFIHTYEAVALAWITQRQLCIEYQSLQSETAKEWILNPYFVEMTGIGYSIYVIGYARREGKEGIITFKLDRILNAEVLDLTFEVPPDLEIENLLASSWGVMWGEEITIKLRFSQRVTRRVKESIWHPSQIINNCPDGGCTLSVTLGSTVEITPWIRSWGSDVEVLEPPELREQFRGWADDLYRMYQTKEG